MMPLLHYTSRKRVMGEFVNNWSTNLLAFVAAGAIISLNAYLLYSFFA
jgi:Mn2+/Fe2+ NRAMP family transporter